jgi:hypothetical protein
MSSDKKKIDWDLLIMAMKPDLENGSRSYLDIQSGAIMTIFEEEWQCYAAGWDVGENQKSRMLLATFSDRYFQLPISSSEQEREELIEDLCHRFGFITQQ